MLRALIFLLPWGWIKRHALRLAGVELGAGARVGPCLVWRCGNVRLGRDVVLGTGNVFRGLADVILEDGVVTGSWNWISATSEFGSRAPRSFVMRRHSALTSRHYVDATGGVEIGPFSTIAGHRSTILTHGIDYERSVQVAQPVQIGAYCLTGTNCVLLAGAVLEDRVIVGGGGVVPGRLTASTVNVGAKARPVKSGVDGAYFHRTRGRVDPPPGS